MRKYKFLRLLAFAAIASFLFGCVHIITDIVMSSNPQAGAEDTIIVKAEFVNGTGTDGYLIFGALFPTNMKMAETATVTWSTSNFAVHGYSDVTELAMVPMEASTLEKMSNSSWASAAMVKFGTMGNFGDFEWVVWRTADTYNLAEPGSDEDPAKRTKADIKITFRNEDRNVKFNFAAWYATTAHGLDNDYMCLPVSKAYQTSGASSSEDYTVPKLVSTTPVKMSYEDVFCVNFVSKLSNPVTNTALAGETDVYLMGKVVLDNGTEVLVDSRHDETNRMTRSGEYEYMKYIYPREFFGVLEGDEMVEMYFWFENVDGTKVENAAGANYAIAQTGTLL